MIMLQVFFGQRKIYNPTNTGPQRVNAALGTKTLLEHYRNYTAVMASIAGYSD